MRLLKLSIIIPFIALQIIANGQTVDKDPLTTEELNDHVTLLLKKKRIYKKLLRQDQHGDSAIYVKVDRSQNLMRDEPFINDGVKYYYWDVGN